MGCFGCFEGGVKRQRIEEESLASGKALAKAAEAAQKRQEQFENVSCRQSAVGTATTDGKAFYQSEQRRPSFKVANGMRAQA